MTESEATEILAESTVVPYSQGDMTYLKQLRDKCLAEGIPATVGCPPKSKVS